MWSPKMLLGLGILLGPVVYCTDEEDTNRATVTKFVELLNAGNYSSLVDLFTSPNATYWLSGSPSRTCGQAGNKTAAQRIAGYPAFMGAFDDFSFVVTSMAAQDDLVLVEGLGTGLGPGTLFYQQTAVWSFRAKGGKLDYMREYLDHQESAFLQSYFEALPYAPSA
ncbi:putative SnoaL-like domain-containing protein [Seiridium cardinale]